MLVTALEATEEVPRWEIVMERLLYEEVQIKQKEVNDSNETKAMTTHHITTKGTTKVFQCRKYGHLKLL